MNQTCFRILFLGAALALTLAGCKGNQLTTDLASQIPQDSQDNSSSNSSQSESIQLSFRPSFPAVITQQSFSTQIVTTIVGTVRVKSLSCQLDSFAPISCDTQSVSLGGLTQGAHTYTVTGLDSLGRVIPAFTQSFSVQLPVQSISLSLSPALPATLTVNSYTGKLVVSAMGGLTLQSASCQLDSNPVFDCTNLGISLSGLTNGNHTLKVTGLDSNGKPIPPLTQAFAVQVPVQSISLSLSPALQGTLAVNSYTGKLVVSATGGLTLQSASCQLDSNAAFNCTNLGVSLSGMTNGSHVLKITGVDSNGKAIPAITQSFVVQVPVQSISLSLSPALPATLAVNSYTGKLVVSATGGLTLQSASCQLDSNAAFDCTNLGVSLSGMANGNHVLKVTGVDSNGKAIPAITQSFAVQVPVQSISLSLSPALQGTLAVNSYNGQLLVSATGGLTLQSASCQLDSNAAFDCTNRAVSLSGMANGSHVLKVTGVDSNGKAIPAITQSFAVQVSTGGGGIGGSGIVNVNPAIKLQVMRGYEAHTFAMGDSPAFPLMINQVLDNAVQYAGIDRIRLEVRAGVENTVDYYAQFKNNLNDPMWRCYRYATVNDNSNPSVVNLNGFHFTELDEDVQHTVLPLLAKMKAAGKHLYINLNYVAFTKQMVGTGCPANLQYDHKDPQEYAEFIGVVYDHLKSKWGIVPDALEVILEPDNANHTAGHWKDGVAIGQAIVATTAVLKAKGYPTNFIAPSNTNIASAAIWMDQMATVPGALANLVEFSYHKYIRYPLATIQQGQQEIAKRVVKYGIPSSMLEFWVPQTDYITLFDDITIAMASAIQIGVLCADPASYSPVSVCDVSNLSNPTVTLAPKAKIISQYFRYMNFGAQRIDAQSSVANYAPLAFINPNGKYLVAVKATAGGTFTVGKLPVGVYGISYSTNSVFNGTSPDQTVTVGSTVTATIPAAGVITIYQK